MIKPEKDPSLWTLVMVWIFAGFLLGNLLGLYRVSKDCDTASLTRIFGKTFICREVK